MNQKLRIRVPLLQTIKSYRSSWLKPDLIAGLTVASLAIPQAMAYSGIAGVPLVVGLISTIVAMLIYALFTTSRYVITGPDAALAAIAGASIIPLIGTNQERALPLIALLALLVGIVTLFSVFARLGFMAEFISRPIMLGYMAGLSLAIIAAQLPILLGFVDQAGNTFFNSILTLIQNITTAHAATIILSILLVLVTLTLKRFSRSTPSALVLLVLSISASYIFDFTGLGIATLGNVPFMIAFPDFSVLEYGDLQNLFVPAIAIAVIAGANTISLSRTYARKSNEAIEVDQEFFGMGLANISSGIASGMPVSPSTTRTAVNAYSKPSSQLAQVAGSLFVGLALILFSEALQYLPYATLAVIVIFAVIPMFDIKEFWSIWHAWRSEALLAVVTVLGVALLGILQGLLLAVLLAVFNWVRKSAFPNDALLGIAADGAVRDMSRPPKTASVRGMIIYRFDAPLFFGNSNYFRDRVMSLVKDQPSDVRWFLWDAETITTIDSTGGEMLLLLIRDLKKQGVTFAIARMKGPIRSIVHNSHRLASVLRDTPHFTSLGEAIEAYYVQYPEARVHSDGQISHVPHIAK